MDSPTQNLDLGHRHFWLAVDGERAAVSIILKVRPVLLRRKPRRLRERSIPSACVSWLATRFPPSPLPLHAPEPHARSTLIRMSAVINKLNACRFKRAPQFSRGSLRSARAVVPVLSPRSESRPQFLIWCAVTH